MPEKQSYLIRRGFVKIIRLEDACVLHLIISLKVPESAPCVCKMYKNMVDTSAYAASTVLIAASYLFSIVNRLLVSLHKSSSKQACSENIEWFVEDKAFSPSYELYPPHPLPYPVSTLSLFLSLPVRRRSSLLTGGGGGAGGRSQIIRRRESLVLYNHLVLSVSSSVPPQNVVRLFYLRRDGPLYSILRIICQTNQKCSTFSLYSASIPISRTVRTAVRDVVFALGRAE
jgi:hypothetical protein